MTSSEPFFFHLNFMGIHDKIERAIEICKIAENLAKHQNMTVELRYSGGKDSDILLDIAKKSGIDFDAVFQNTTVENPITAKYIRERMKTENIKWVNPPKNFYEICKDKKMLPSIWIRFCCKPLKYNAKKNVVTLLGIRKAESKKRESLWNEFSDKKKLRLPFSEFSKLFDEKCKQKTAHFNPLFNFTNRDVKEYIRINNLQINPIYKTQTRCCCWLCPFASVKEKINVIKQNPSILKPLVKLCDFLAAEKPNYTSEQHLEMFIKGRHYKQQPQMFSVCSELKQILEVQKE